jgi:hypothetical protein
MIVPGRTAPAPAMASAFRNFLREAPESNGLPFEAPKSAGVSGFPEARLAILISSKLQKNRMFRCGET